MESSPLIVVVVVGADAAHVRRVLASLAGSRACILALAPALTAHDLPGAFEVAGPVALQPGRVIVVPFDRAVALDAATVSLAAPGPGAPIDRLLRATAAVHGRSAAAAVVGGAARGLDAALGIKSLKEAGGLTIAEDLAGDDLGDLPRSAIGTGFVDLVLPLEAIGERLAAFAPADRAPLVEPDAQSGGGVDLGADTLRDILTLVRVRSGHDFSAYKRATLLRRVSRRMQVCDTSTLAAYLTHLREHPSELGKLLRDFLISVTNFFRDPDAFAVLERDFIPRVFQGKGPGDHVRVWVAGCATGEEAYSIGMLLLERAAQLAAPPHIQVFATDIDEVALAEARAGSYSETIAADLSADRLQRFFTRETDRYRVTKELRELVLFSPHNVLRDPPFSRLDLVSCRNVLIYLDRDAQQRVLAMFHFGLLPEGCLFLGSSESAENSTMFAPVDTKARVFARRTVPPSLGDTLSMSGRRLAPLPQAPSQPDHRITPLGELHYRLLEQVAPPSLVVNAELEIVHLSESAGRFLQLGGGEPSRQLLRLLVAPLRLDVRTAIYTARQHGREQRTVQYELDGVARTVEITVVAVDVPELGHGAALVVLRPVDSVAEREPRPSAPALGNDPTIEPVVREIEDELLRTRDQLRTTVEQYETSLEELKASNEELQAINEELRSATEELETSKEELQSVNEELTTLNHELKVKVDEVSTANSDLQNLITSTDIGVVFLDRSLNIKRFTPRAGDLFNVIPSDIGRPLAHLTHRLEAVDLTETALSVLQSLRSAEREVRSLDGRHYLARWLPYRSLEDRIEGVVLTFVDVTDQRDAIAARNRSEEQLRSAEARLRGALRVAPIAVLAYDASGAVTWAFGSGRDLGADPAHFLARLAPGDADRLAGAVAAALAHHAGQRLEVSLDGEHPQTFDFRVEPMAAGALAVGYDISNGKRVEQVLRETDRRKDEFLATLSHELRNPLAPLRVALDVARLGAGDAAQRGEALDIMDRQVRMLSTLVDELLDLSRITQGKIELARAPVDLAGVLEDALEMTRSAVAAAKQDLRVEIVDANLEVIGDRRRLVQIVTNLLANATKYTPEGGRIEVRLRGDRTRERAVLEVRDSGIGIAAPDLANIFDIFYQCRDATGRAKGGLGIGLNIVRKLVELHGGTAHAASDGPGRGSTFTIELPWRRT